MLRQHLAEGPHGVTEGVYRQREMIPKASKHSSAQAISVRDADHQFALVGQDPGDLFENLVRMLHVLEGMIHAHVVKRPGRKGCVQERPGKNIEALFASSKLGSVHVGLDSLYVPTPLFHLI